MIKKQKITLLLGFLILINCIVTTTIGAQQTKSPEIKSTENDNTYHLVVTTGPAWIKLFTKIEFIDGNPLKISELNRYFTRKILSKVVKPVYVKDLTFKIIYRLPVTLFSRFSYLTLNTTDVDIQRLTDPEYLNYLLEMIKDLTNYTSFTRNKRHIVTFENFTGAFYLQNAKLFRKLPPKFFLPVKFIAVGICDDIIKI